MILINIKKHEKNNSLNLNDLNTLCVDMYSEDKYHEMELKLLKTLKWKLVIKVPLDFIDILAFSMNLDLNDEMQYQLEMLLDLCLLSKIQPLFIIRLEFLNRL